MTAAEHFLWARARALEYVHRGDGPGAMASLVSDLNKHEGTARILTDGMLTIFTGEVILAGAVGARRFIEGLPLPAPGTVGGIREATA